MKWVPDFRKADFEGLKRYVQVTSCHETDRESQLKIRMEEEWGRLGGVRYEVMERKDKRVRGVCEC